MVANDKIFINECVLVLATSIAKLGPKSNVCLKLVCGYCIVGSHVQCGFK
jgi:hypothetical protein